MKIRNPETGRIEHRRYPWPRPAPYYNMGQRKSTRVRRTDSDQRRAEEWRQATGETVLPPSPS